MDYSGKYIPVDYGGKRYILLNQRCRQWSHPYEWAHDGSTLSSAGCGVFSTIHASQYLGGDPTTPEELADFACATGGRGDDGTDRPRLLAAMEEAGLARRFGFSYRMDGLRNDLNALYDHLAQGGAALCNLRPGHIVALIGGREENGEKQALAADPYSESADPRVREAVRETVAGSEVVFPIANERGIVCGQQTAYALFWVSVATVRDFNLLHRLHP